MTENASPPEAPSVSPEVIAQVLAQAAAASAPAAAQNGDGVKRFTSRKPTAHFYVDEDRFDVITTLPAGLFSPLLAAFTSVGADVDKQYQASRNVMQVSLTPESWARYEPRLMSLENPIGHVDLVLHAAYTIEVQSAFPTGLAQSSTDSPGTTQPTSTGGALPTA